MRNRRNGEVKGEVRTKMMMMKKIGGGGWSCEEERRERYSFRVVWFAGNKGRGVEVEMENPISLVG